MVALGVGEIVGSQAIGAVVDKVNSKFAVLVIMGLLGFAVVATIVYLIIYKFSWLAFVMAFLWGAQDGAVNTHCMEMMGFEFDDNAIVFAVFSLFQGIVCFFANIF